MDKAFNRGLLVGILLMIGATAIHWFLTPGLYADATGWRKLMVAGQAAFGLGGALWVYLVHRLNRR